MDSSLTGELYLATLNTVQVILLAWIGAEQRASAVERKHRRERELNGNPEPES